nr:cytochrome p450 monooxygenase pyr9 [Quercus suber]
MQAKQILEKGRREVPGCFQVSTLTGWKLVVPNRFADELRNHPHLNFNEFFAKDLFVDYPGFEGPRAGLKYDTFIQEVVRVNLTQSLGLITEDLVDEAAASFGDIWGDSSEWSTRRLRDDMLDVVARLSARVFLGKELCRNKEWLTISKEYTINVFVAAQMLRMVPAPLRPLLHWFIPQCKAARKQVAAAHKLITPEVEDRVKQARGTLASGEKISKTANAVGWMVECARGRPVDFVAAQLSLSMAAIHTTSENMCRCLLQLCQTPEIVEPLREEAIKVLSVSGWDKAAMSQMKLMDSFLKEVQRTAALSSTNMSRVVKKPIKLSNGFELPAGCDIFVTDDRVNDPALYDEPARFDVGRFMRMRQRAGEEHRHQYVTVSSTHLGFGYGQHACPGRFFASNELKVALAFALLQYEFRAPAGEQPAPFLAFETSESVQSDVRIQVRTRTPEIDPVHPKL